MQDFLLIEGEPHPAALLSDGRGGYRTLELGPVSLAAQLDGRMVFSCAHGTSAVEIVRDGARLWVYLEGGAYELQWQSAAAHYEEEAGGGGEDVARAPMPGAVVSVAAKPGDHVKAGDVLLIIESMKLETAIKASRDGVVEIVHVTAGQTIERDAALVTLHAEAA
jgi:acetyl/propionyl-CoA carboxylase alpha subunit